MFYKELLETLINYLDEGILIVDIDGNIVLFNEKATTMNGVTLNEIVGMNILDVFSNITIETSQLFKVMREKKPLLNYNQTFDNLVGRKGQIVGSSIPLIANNQVYGALEIQKDLTNILEMSEKINILQNQLFSEGFTHKLRGNGTSYTIDDIIGDDKEIIELKNKIKKIANSNSPVLVFGETGTGKELVVQAIHNESIERKMKPFIAQNCAALPGTLLESVIFGTTKGSFTGASDKKGLFELANGGTLFLDEINSMDIELQAKLLRVIQNGVIRRLGSEKQSVVDVRIIAATNEEPIEAIENRKLRKDLFYRLSVLELRISSLKNRKNDIEVLANYFINGFNVEFNKSIKPISQEVASIFKEYDWPGNVRELRFIIERIMNFMDGNEIRLEDIPESILKFKERKDHNHKKEIVVKNESLKQSDTLVEIREFITSNKFADDTNDLKLIIEKIINFTEINKSKIENIVERIENLELKKQKDVFEDEVPDLREYMNQKEKEIIEKVIDMTYGNCAKTAALLKIPKQTLYNKVKKYNIDVANKE